MNACNLGGNGESYWQQKLHLKDSQIPIYPIYMTFMHETIKTAQNKLPQRQLTVTVCMYLNFDTSKDKVTQATIKAKHLQKHWRETLEGFVLPLAAEAAPEGG